MNKQKTEIVMKIKVTKQDKLILKSFLENKIPSCIKFDDELPHDFNVGLCGHDLMEGYEDLFNFSHDLLDNREINLSRSSFGSGTTFVCTQKYEDILLALAQNSDDIELKIHCYLSLVVLTVLSKYNMVLL